MELTPVEYKKKSVELVLNECLLFLIEKGFVNKNELESGQINVRHDMSDRLESLQFFLAASIDNAGRAVMVFNPKYDTNALAWGIPHEAIHLAQICKGDWEPCMGYSIWKGEKFTNLKAEDPNYFSSEHQPWEAEAEQLAEEVRDAMYERLPSLENPQDEKTAPK